MSARSGRRLSACLTLLAVFSGTEAPTQDSPSTEASSSGGALVELGRLQTELTEFDTAEENYLAGIELLIEENGEFAPTLIEPYTGLARAYLLNQRPLEAIAALEQAQHISQRNFGLLNLDQAPLLDEMSRAYLLIGDTAEAQNVQRARLTLALRRFGADDPRVIPFRNQLADYYDLSRMRVHAREQYEAVLDIQRENFGENDGRLLVPLSELLRIDILLGGSSSARRRLLQVLESSENASPVEVGNALAALGDWEQARRRTEAALEYYRDAFATLHVEDPSIATEFFAAPRFINFVPPPSPVDRRGNRNPHAWGSIAARFRVSSDGRATDVIVAAANPAGLMDSRYVERLAEAAYRPRLLDGEPVDTTQVTFSHQFRYFVAVRDAESPLRP